MFCPLMMDPRIGWIQPEQKGPAYNVWKDILEDVTSPTNSENFRGKEFIPLNRNINSHETTDGTALKNLINADKSNENKKKKFENETPWRSKDKSYPDGVVGLHIEILDFYEYMKPRPAEHAMRDEVVRRVQEVIVLVWPTAKVEVYGSFRTGLYLPTSDIDLVVFGSWERLPLWTLEKALTANSIADECSIKVLDKASVPIIKLTDQKTGVKVDISFNVPAGLKAAEFVKDQVELFPCLPPLVFVLKQFLLQRDLNEVFTGGISSYSLILMAISFLQHHPRSDGRTLESNLGVLLIEFLELYGHQINYTNVGIRVKDGGSYFSKQEVLNVMDESFMLLCIEDPFTAGNYIGKSSYKFMEVRQAFDYAYYTLSKPVLQDTTSDYSYNQERNLSTVDREREEVDCGYLSRVVRVNNDVVDYRKWVASLWSPCSTVPPTTNKQLPTYASIANKHIQSGVVKTQGMTSQDLTMKSATWPLARSQSNVETLVSDTALLEGQGQLPLARHPSVDSLSSYTGGIEMRVWSAKSVQKLVSSFTEENSAKRKMKSGDSVSSSKPVAENLRSTSPPSSVHSYSGAIKQSLHSPSKQSSATSTRTTTAECSSKLVSASSSSSPQKKTVDDHKSSKNASVAISPKPVSKTFGNLCKDNGGGKQSYPSSSSTTSRNNNNNNNNNSFQNNNSKSNNSGPKSPTRQRPKSRKGKSTSQS